MAVRGSHELISAESSSSSNGFESEVCSSSIFIDPISLDTIKTQRMAPKRKLTEEQVREKKKEYARKRRERIKNDPILAAIEAEKERKKYEMKKKKKQVKLVKHMSSRELRVKRKEWRVKAKIAYDRRKQHANVVRCLAEQSPPNSDIEIQQVEEDGRRSSGRKRVRKARSKMVRENKKLLHENEVLRKQANKWRQKHWRLKASLGNQKSPRTVVRKLLRRGNKLEIRRKLVFGEAVKHQLACNFNGLTGSRKKREFGKLVAGDAKILRRYNLLTDLRGSISTKVFNSVHTLTNNKLLKSRMKKINEMVRLDVCKFFEDDEVSKLCPGKRDCLTRNKLKKQNRILTDSLKNLHAKFLEKVEFKIGYVSFCKLKPFWVVQHKVSERDTCMCTIHANMEFLASALFKTNIIDNADPKSFARHICCDVSKVECLQRKCAECNNLTIPYLLYDEASSVSFFKWQTITSTYLDKKQNPRIVKQIVKDKVTVSAMEAVDIFETTFIKFLFHEGNVIHQFRSIKALKTRMKEDEALIHCDFSENYSMKYASEVQAFHFGGSRKQFTLHTCEVYYKKDYYSNLISQSMCTLSECLEHGPAAVWAHLQPVLDFVKRSIPRIRVIHFLSDSPATQYRNKTVFYLIVHALQQSIGVETATWNYMERGHGKGAPDGVGGCLKRIADRVVAQGHDIDSFQRFVEVLKDNVRKIEISVVGEEEVDGMKGVLPSYIPTFKGTMKVHQVVYQKENPHVLTMRGLSCFSCFDCDHHCLGHHELKPTDQPAQLPRNFDQSECEIQTSLSTTTSTSPQNHQLQSIPSTSAHQPLQNAVYIPGSYLLAMFQSTSKKKTVDCYRYVCCIEKVNVDGTLRVNGLRCFENSLNQFVIKDNDTCLINPTDIINVLPPPNFLIKSRKIIFSFPCDIDVKEK